MTSVSRAFLSSGTRAERSNLFFGLFLLASLNGVANAAIRAVTETGWPVAFGNLFGTSAIVWLAFAAGLAILHEQGEAEPLRRGDLPIAAIVLAVALVPIATASALSLTMLAAYAIATSAGGSPLRRSAIIFLAATGAMIWGRLLLGMFSRPLLDIDAIFVARMLGAQHQGNMIWHEGVAHRLVVAPGCSSMQGMSLALVFWATVNQYFRVAFTWRSAMWCLLALLATIAINVLRIGALLNFPEHMGEIHHGYGWQIALWTTFVAVVAICIYGARREIFRRR